MGDAARSDALEADGITVRFSGLLVLDEVSITVPRGVVTGLVGPNGAGKSTLFNVLSGLLSPSSGAVRLGDRDITNLRPHRRSRLGLARTFQRLELFGSMTVLDNLLVAAETRFPGGSRGPRVLAERALERAGVAGLADRPAGTLPTGSARLVELARALACDPTVLLLDEPSSGLDDAETEAFATVLGSLVSEGVGILLVEHNIPMVMGLCAEITVLDLGRCIATGPPQTIRDDAAVQAAYLGVKADA